MMTFGWPWFFMAKSYLLSRLLYGKNSWSLKTFIVHLSCIKGQDFPLTFYQCISYFGSFKLSVMFKWRVLSLSCLLMWLIQRLMVLLFRNLSWSPGHWYIFFLLAFLNKYDDNAVTCFHEVLFSGSYTPYCLSRKLHNSVCEMVKHQSRRACQGELVKQQLMVERGTTTVTSHMLLGLIKLFKMQSTHKGKKSDQRSQV